jgi:hypothetical protein
LKFSHVFWSVGKAWDAEDSDLKTGGAGAGATLFLIGTPPPLPRGAFVSLPFAWYFVLSLPFEELSDTDSAHEEFVGGGRLPEEISDGTVFSRGRLLLPPSCVELLRDVAWLLKL